MTPPPENGKSVSITLLTINGQMARMEGKFQITDSIQIECEVGGELEVGGRLVIGERGVVNADVQTVDAVIMGRYEGNMVATGNVEIAATGRVTGNIQTDSLVISKGGFFNGNISKIGEGAVKDIGAAKAADTRGVVPLGKKRSPFEERRPTPQHDERRPGPQHEERRPAPQHEERRGSLAPTHDDGRSRPAYDDKTLSRHYTPRQQMPSVEPAPLDEESRLREAE